MRIWACILLFVPLTLQQQRSSDDRAGSGTCSLEDFTMCEIHAESSARLLPEENELFMWGRIPQRLSVVNTSGIHISVKTAAKYHEERLSLLMLTWLQTLEPQQVTPPFEY